MTPDELAAIVEGIAPVVREVVARAVADLTVQHAATTGHLVTLVDATQAIGPMRERLATLEARAPVPGPRGPAGQDGTDGLGYDDLTLDQADETTVTLKARRGDQVKVIGSVTFPIMRFTGDYESGRDSLPGHVVRYKSALWYCGVATMLAPDAVMYDASGKPSGPQGKDCWTLVLSERRR